MLATKDFTENSGSNVITQDVEKAFLSVGILTFQYYPQKKLMIASDSFSEFFGCNKVFEQMPQSLAETLIHIDDYQALFDMADEIDNGNVSVSANLRTKAGFLSRVTVTATKVDSKGKILESIGIVQKMENEVRSTKAIEALSSDYSSVYYVDCKKNKVYPHRLSKEIEERFGSVLRQNPPYEQIIKRYIESEVIEDERQEMNLICSMENLKSLFTKKDIHIHDYRIKRNGEIRYCRMKIVNLSENGEMDFFTFGFSDMTSLKTVELEQYAFVDPLTGGNNYNGFKKKVRENGIDGSFISMDIHNFKIINTVCGVNRGDEVMKEIWKHFTYHSPENAICCRINADHFVMYVPKITERDVIKTIQILSFDLMDLSTDLEIPKLIPYFGISKWNKTKEIETTISETNVAKNEAKYLKSDNYLFYSEEETKKILFEKKLEDAFASDLENGNFEIWYQPKYDPRENLMIGAEALTRWKQSDGTYLSPATFIPLFESDGLIKTLDEYVFRKVCEFQKNRLDNKKKIIPISINLSRASLYFGDVVARYRRIVESIKISPELIPIEITESATVGNEDSMNVMKRFKSSGFPILMDDFGTGYSSLSSLNAFHFDTLKIDKSLVDYIGDANGNKLLEHTIGLSKDLGMKVTAEGVESETQVEFLKKLGCDSIQGFFYSKPLPPKEFSSLLD